MVSQVGELLRFHTFAAGGDQIVLDPNSQADFAQKFSNLLIRLSMMEQALKASVPRADENSISIRLPAVKSLAELSKLAAEVDEILRPILELEDKESHVQVSGFDTGSMWILVSLGSRIALYVVRNICQAARTILELSLELKRAQISVKRLNVEAKILATIEAEADRTRREQIREAAEKIDSQDFASSTARDRIGRIERSIDLLAQINEKGGEIQPALEELQGASDEEKFPDIGKLLKERLQTLAPSQGRLLGPPGEDEPSK